VAVIGFEPTIDYFLRWIGNKLTAD